MTSKVSWAGRVFSVQPRIRLNRSFDERNHSYLGFALFLEGTVGGEEREFSIGIGKAAQAVHRFRVGLVVAGESVPVRDPRLEPVEFYRTSGLRIVEDDLEPEHRPPPWMSAPPELTVYRERGHRRLSAATYEAKCRACMWGCRMPVEMIIDHWKPDLRKYRSETFCYGPKSCPFYSPGPTRKVPGRRGMSHEEEDWVDDEETAHRGPDD